MKTLRIHPDDNVEILLDGARAGHKVAIRAIPSGAPVLKYGSPIGTATRDIAPGEWVHTQNLRTSLLGEVVYTYTPDSRGNVSPGFSFSPRSFSGYRRPDGRVGVRNDLWIIPTVACVNALCQRLASAFSAEGGSALPLCHPYGCSQLGGDAERTTALLVALAEHPNAGGVLVVGLGCENNTLDSFRARIDGFQGHPVSFLCAQDEGDELQAGLRLLRRLAEQASTCVRESIEESELVIGLKCGGSDGLSGLSANTVIGRFSDRLSAQGGTTVLTEIPELFGAEHLLLNRCIDRNVFDRAANVLNGFKRYYLSRNLPVYENPSPGNKEGGITTLEEKSLGCVHKSGSAPVTDVLDYAQKAVKHGVSLLWGPGNDPVAATALAASGCHIILFSTGRGTPYGTVVPTLKISSNTPLSLRKPAWIDFDAGGIASGIETPDACAARLYDLVLSTASGALAKNESAGAREIAIFKDGVTL